MLDVDIEHRLGSFRLRVRFTTDTGVTALFGRSGSGKTTLINVIAGLLRPERGRVAVEGEALFDSARGIDVPAPRRRVGCVFQEGRLFPHLTIRQNLTYGRFFIAVAERYISFDPVVELLGLEHLLERRPGALSGGEKQRVAIGRALLANPRVLLMDEPLASLDSARKSEILQYIEQLRAEFGIPIVYVSHAIEEVMRLADTLVVLSEGEVAAIGKTHEILGRLNLQPVLERGEVGAVIEATAIAYDENYDLTTLHFAGGELTVANLDALMGETVRVHIRARDVSLALQHPAGTSVLNVLRGQVSEIGDKSGASVDVRIRVGDAHVVARITRRSLDQLHLHAGREVYALVKAISLDRDSVGFA